MNTLHIYKFCIALLTLVLSHTAASETLYLGTAGVGDNHYFGSGAGFYSVPVRLFESFELAPGIGGRATYFYGAKRKYQTGGVRERESQSLEFLQIKNAQHLSVNNAVAIEGRYLPWGVFAGFNIDTVGWSFAPKRSLDGIDLDGSGWNSLRGGYNDLGTLHSEAYIGMKVPHWDLALRLGTSHSVTQYRTISDGSPLAARRFLNFSDTFFVGVSI